MTETTRDVTMPSRRELWFGLLAAPAAYGVVAMMTYAIAPASCQLGLLQTPILGTTLLGLITFAVSVLGLLAVMWGGYTAYRNWHRARNAGAESDDRQRFLAVGGVMLSVLFLAMTLFAGLSGLAFQPCVPT